MDSLPLNGRWQTRQAAHPNAEWLPATVPGVIHTDLLAAGAIPDPFYRDNEKQVLWVGEADWLYRRQFDAPADFLRHDHVVLRCAGLDTLATIWLNGQEIGRADNMFHAWEFNARPFLRPGENEIEIRFDSALRYGQARLAERYIHSWSTEDHKLPGGNYVRKAQCHFGWDWGPQLVTCGIWRDIELLAWDSARLVDLHIRQDHRQPGTVGLAVRATLEGKTAVSRQLHIRLSLDGELVAAAEGEIVGEMAVFHLPIANPQLWWPNGLGKQPLYLIDVEVRGENGRFLDRWQQRIGLRTLELVRQKDQWGESFHFACNGVPFFAKGANWIPADSFITRLTDERYADLLGAAAAAHMNMLRVWGGGIYEQPILYDLCDELGICVWQDFMFGCATYPTFDDAFMANVLGEAAMVVRQLRHHACLALWCGNNELEQGLVQDSWNPWAMSWADYGKLFDDQLPKLVAKLDPDTAYWPSSPHTPYDDRRDWNDPRWGDAHIWDVWHGMKPFEFYYTCFHRFNSEFGFQSFPEPQMVRRFALPEEENITSYVMEYHQRSPSGNSKIMHYLLEWFRLPTSFDMTLWLSQILQGMAVKHAVEHWRRTMPRGMGTLYWQLNDCWPGPSWSSLDYDGRWKALHYLARHFYAPLLLSAVPDGEAGAVAVYVTNDHLQQLAGEVRWLATTAQGEMVAEGRETAVILPNQNTPIAELDLQPYLARHSPRDLLVWLELWVDGAIIAENLALFARPKHLALTEPEIVVVVEGGENGRCHLTFTTAKPALWVWLELPDGCQLSDNFFHLRPGSPRVITLIGAETADNLQVYSLVDTYRACSVNRIP
jgi:beta-mannosidase